MSLRGTIRCLCVLLCVFVPLHAFAAIGDLVATISIPGMPPGCVYSLNSNPNGYFAIQNTNQLVEAINTPPGNYTVGISASCAGGVQANRQFTLNFAGTPVGNYAALVNGSTFAALVNGTRACLVGGC